MRVGFGEFLIDADTRELLLGDQPVRLSPKAFQLLVTLISNRPKAMSKSELHEYLWPETFVVEANLSNLIGEIRAALGDNRRDPRFVRTVPRFGYAFAHEAREAAGRDQKIILCRMNWADGGAAVTEGDHIIGRDPKADVIVDSPSVSRRHARIHIAEGQAFFEDLGSKNGSSIAGRRTHGPVALADGDLVTVGVIQITVRLFQPTRSTATVASLDRDAENT